MQRWEGASWQEGFGVWGSGFVVGFRVSDSVVEFQGPGFGFQDTDFGFRVSVLGYRFSRFRVQGPGFRFSGSGVRWGRGAHVLFELEVDSVHTVDYGHFIESHLAST